LNGPPSAATGDRPDEGERWYWRNHGEIRGPLATAELDALIQQNRLADSDAVRLESSDEWIPAAEIRKLFQAGDQPANTAARLLETAAVRRMQGTVPPQRHTVHFQFGDALSRLWRPFEATLGFFVAAAVQLFHVLGRGGRTILTVAAGIAVVTFFGWKLDLFSPGEADRQAQLVSIWLSIEASEAAAPRQPPQLPPDRQRWLEAVEAELATELKEQPISGGSSSQRRIAIIRRHLLFAARGIRQHLAAPEPDDAAEIRQELESARDLLSGVTLATAPPLAAASRRDKPLLIAMLALDGALVLAGVVWWIRQKG
jgi:hypothetical protein